MCLGGRCEWIGKRTGRDGEMKAGRMRVGEESEGKMRVVKKMERRYDGVEARREEVWVGEEKKGGCREVENPSFSPLSSTTHSSPFSSLMAGEKRI